MDDWRVDVWRCLGCLRRARKQWCKPDRYSGNMGMVMPEIVNAFMFYGLCLDRPDMPRYWKDRLHHLCWRVEHEISHDLDQVWLTARDHMEKWSTR